jgi:anti-anti-sigma regulatory factor
MRVGDLAVDVERRGKTTTIRCRGALDVSTCRDLQTCLDGAVAAGPGRLELDGSGISLLTAAGIKCLVEAELACSGRGIDLDMTLSPKARKVLDLVGLWWLGVVKDGISAEIALEQALRNYGNRTVEGPQVERLHPPR